MKVAVSSTGKEMSAQIDPRFGRCAYFIVVDTDDMQFKIYENHSNQLGGGAGIQAASFVVNKGAQAVLTGNCGPKAMFTFEAAGVAVYTAQTGTVAEAVQRFKTGGLAPSRQPTVSEKAGLYPGTGSGYAGGGGGMGRCRGGFGRGMGRSMQTGMGGGRGMGRGLGVPAGLPDAAAPVTSANSGQESLSELKKQAEHLKRQMEMIQAKIDSMK